MKKALAAVLAWAAFAAQAEAHIVFAEPNAAAGAYYAGFLRVSHGCGASPTVALRVEIPAGVNIARPQPKPGWSLEIEKEALAAPIPTEGGQIAERVTAVTWRGLLPVDQFDQFGLMLKLPNAAGPLYFAATQTCESGEQRWSDIPAVGQAWHSVPHPAPVLTITALVRTETPTPAQTDSGHARHH